MTSDVRQNDLVSRVKAILMSPKTEWPVIEAEPATPADIYTKYAIILAAIPAIAGFLKSSIIGITIPFGGTIRVGIVSGLTNAVMSYVLSLVGIFILALIIDALGPTFGGTKNQVQALKTAAYSYTAAWVAGAATVVPMIGMLVVLAGSLYSLYLLYLGLPIMMKSPPERALSYTAVVVLCAIVLGIIISMVLVRMPGGAALSVGALGSGSNSDVQFDPNSPLGQLEGYANQLEQASKNLETAGETGDAQAQQDALGQMLGAVLGNGGGGGGTATSLPVEQIRSFVPASLAGLARKTISAERNQMFGIQISQAEASYSDDAGKALDLEIMDLGGTAGLMALAAWANIEQEKQTATGYERTYKQGGRTLHETWDGQSRNGEFEVIIANRFMVKVSGNADSMDALKAAAAGIDLAGLERLPTAAR